MADFSVAVEGREQKGHETARRERDRRAIKTGAVGVVVQAMNHAIRLVVIPLSISMLGVEQYGLFLVVGSLVAWGGMTDLGLAPGLINVVAAAHGRGDREGMRRAISTAFVAYGMIAILVALLTVAVSRWDGLPELLGARTPELAQGARTLVLVCGLTFAGMTVTRVAASTAQALQEGYWMSYAHIGGCLVSLFALAGLTLMQSGLLAYSVAVCLPPALAQVALAWLIFGRRYKDLHPGPKWFNWKSLRELSGFAGPLMLQQVANLVILYSANLLIANRLGVNAVPSYSIPYAAFATLIGICWLAVSPYMPAYAEASARGDMAWVMRRGWLTTTASAALVAVGGLALVGVGPWLLSWWTKGAITADRGLLWALLFFAVLRVASNSSSVLLTGIGRVWTVAGSFAVAAAVFVLGAWWMLPTLGISAVPLACGAGHVAIVLTGWLRRG